MINFRNDVLPLKNRLYRLALRITMHTGEAEDIVQETMIRVWNNREKLENTASVEAFSITTCRNLSLDYLAHKESQNESLDAIPTDKEDESSNNPFQQLSREDSLQWVMKLFNQLPEKQKTIMQLRDIEGKTYQEIAQTLNITEENVKVGLFRARQRIKKEFERINQYGL